MVGDNKQQPKNSVEIEAYLKPSWVLASTNIKLHLVTFKYDIYTIAPLWALRFIMITFWTRMAFLKSTIGTSTGVPVCLVT
jgi:hypothetical protein